MLSKFAKTKVFLMLTTTFQIILPDSFWVTELVGSRFRKYFTIENLNRDLDSPNIESKTLCLPKDEIFNM